MSLSASRENSDVHRDAILVIIYDNIIVVNIKSIKINWISCNVTSQQ